MKAKKENFEVSAPNVGTGGLKKILKVSVLYMGFRVERLGSIYKKRGFRRLGFSVRL